MFAVLAATRFAHFAAICLLFGLTAFPFYAGAASSRSPWLRPMLLACGILAFVTGGLEFMAMAGNMGDSWRSSFDPQILMSAATDTDFGRIWIGRLMLAIVIICLCLNSKIVKNLILLFVSAALLMSVAFTGHSAMPGGLAGTGHQIVDAAHLLAAGWWVGGLLALALSAGSLGDQVLGVLGRFSKIGYGAVAVLIASGLVKSAILVTPASAIATSAYGWLLLGKIALFGNMSLLALSNRRQLTPEVKAAADPSRWASRLRLRVVIEFGFGLLVLAVVGALGVMQPPISQ